MQGACARVMVGRVRAAAAEEEAEAVAVAAVVAAAAAVVDLRAYVAALEAAEPVHVALSRLMRRCFVACCSPKPTTLWT